MPVFIQLPADLITPTAAYLKVSNGSRYSFMLESIVGGESMGRYSFIGAGESSQYLPMSTVLTNCRFDHPRSI